MLADIINVSDQYNRDNIGTAKMTTYCYTEDAFKHISFVDIYCQFACIVKRFVRQRSESGWR